MSASHQLMLKLRTKKILYSKFIWAPQLVGIERNFEKNWYSSKLIFTVYVAYIRLPIDPPKSGAFRFTYRPCLYDKSKEFQICDAYLYSDISLILIILDWFTVYKWIKWKSNLHFSNHFIKYIVMPNWTKL